MVESVRLLHVDDEPEHAEMTAEFLERVDGKFDVETATSGEKALDKLADSEFDCVVSDYEMPGQSGIELLADIRDDRPDIPFILFTGKGSEEVASEAITAGATDYLQKQSGTDQYELLAHRVTNAVEQYRATRHAANLQRIRRVVRDVNQVLVRAESREIVERRACEIISDADPYRFAWIGEHDEEAGTIVPRANAGVEAGYLDSVEITTDGGPTSRGPTATAVRTRELAVVQNIPEDPAYEPWRDEALERDFRSSAAIPIVRDETLYGVLNVYADRENAFDDQERELLHELGDDLAHALYARTVRSELRETTERFKALFENAPTPVMAGHICDDGDRFVIRDANEAFEETFDFDADAISGEEVATVVVPEDGIDRHEEFKAKALRGAPSIAEVERITSDGTRKFLLHVIPYDVDDGRAEGWFAWYSDITEKEDRQRELKRYEQIIQEMNDGVVFVEDEVITFTNPQIAEMTGYDSDELHGQPMEKFIAPEDREIVSDRFRERIAGDDPPSTYEISILPKDDDPIPVEITAGRVEHDGRPATVSIVRDVTERKKRKQELERRNERLDEFASIVSHELRNPLSVANGRLELARIEHDSEHLDHAVVALDRMEKLIDNLLTLAREGQQVEDTESIDLSRIAENCWLNVETPEATLELETERSVRAAPSSFQQLLENLMRNAVEHGGQEVTVTIGDVDDGFYVEDDGPGIPAAERETVFQSGHSTKTNGTGFGLAIVERIVEAHDWDVRVSDGANGGARFEITGVEFVR